MPAHFARNSCSCTRSDFPEKLPPTKGLLAIWPCFKSKAGKQGTGEVTEGKARSANLQIFVVSWTSQIHHRARRCRCTAYPSTRAGQIAFTSPCLVRRSTQCKHHRKTQEKNPQPKPQIANSCNCPKPSPAAAALSLQALDSQRQQHK